MPQNEKPPNNILAQSLIGPGRPSGHGPDSSKRLSTGISLLPEAPTGERLGFRGDLWYNSMRLGQS